MPAPTRIPALAFVLLLTLTPLGQVAASHSWTTNILGDRWAYFYTRDARLALEAATGGRALAQAFDQELSAWLAALPREVFDPLTTNPEQRLAEALWEELATGDFWGVDDVEGEEFVGAATAMLKGASEGRIGLGGAEVAVALTLAALRNNELSSMAGVAWFSEHFMARASHADSFERLGAMMLDPGQALPQAERAVQGLQVVETAERVQDVVNIVFRTLVASTLRLLGIVTAQMADATPGALRTAAQPDCDAPRVTMQEQPGETDKFLVDRVTTYHLHQYCNGQWYTLPAAWVFTSRLGGPSTLRVGVPQTFTAMTAHTQFYQNYYMCPVTSVWACKYGVVNTELTLVDWYDKWGFSHTGRTGMVGPGGNSVSGHVDALLFAALSFGCAVATFRFTKNAAACTVGGTSLYLVQSAHDYVLVSQGPGGETDSNGARFHRVNEAPSSAEGVQVDVFPTSLPNGRCGLGKNACSLGFYRAAIGQFSSADGRTYDAFHLVQKASVRLNVV